MRGGPQGRQRRTEHEIAVAAGENHVTIRSSQLGADGRTDPPTARRAAAAEICPRPRSPVIRAYIVRVAQRIVHHDGVGLENSSQLVGDPTRVQRPAAAGFLPQPFVFRVHFALARFQAFAPLGNAAHIALLEHPCSRVINRPRRRARRDRKPEIGLKFHRLVVRQYRVHLGPDDFRPSAGRRRGRDIRH